MSFIRIGTQVVKAAIKYGKHKLSLLQPMCNQTSVVKAATKYGKHKVPRFIYHMTNKSNYKSMLKDGVIKTTQDDFFGKGVFAIELTNLFKRWRNNKSWGGSSLQQQLIQQATKVSDDIVILKIPTEKLNHDLLKVRSQNALFSWENPVSFTKIIRNADVEKELKQLPKGKDGFGSKYISILRKKLLEKKGIATHLLEGSPANVSKLFKQRKQALEYIYKEEIPITAAEKIGEVNIERLRSSAEYNPTKPMRSIFTALLKGTPEVKGAELLNC
jgi:hypothetical protein